MNPSRDEFAAMLEGSFGGDTPVEGSVITGRVTAIENDFVVIDVGLKTEGRIALSEFGTAGGPAQIEVGDEVDVFLDRIENAYGEAVLSRDKARREESWAVLEKSFEAGERIEGVIFGRVKGGFTVDLNGATAFLPGSQIDVRPVRDVTPLMNRPHMFQILKMDRRRGNIVISRRAILEETRAEARSEIVQNLAEGQIIEGVVKNITEYGAFVDLGGVDGLLHVTDMAWRRINHPAEVLNVGETLQVQIVKINPETQRISLGIKQLQDDPWEGVENKFALESKHTGRVTNITEYGAFVELEDGIEGLIHVSEMSWVKKNVHPGKIVSTSQEVEVMVLEIDMEKRRISLGLKQCIENPWTHFAKENKVGSKLSGEIRNITEFGLFVGLDDEMDGMVHMSDLAWNMSGEAALEQFKKGQTVDVIILDIDIEKERISLGIKQLADDPQMSDDMRKGAVVTCTVKEVNDGGLEVTIGESAATAFIRRSDLSRDRQDQRPERFAIGDKIDAMVTNRDAKTRRISLSVKALEIAEEKEAVQQYGSSDSGATLGDILGEALTESSKDTPKAKKAAPKKPEEKAEKKPAAKKAAAKKDTEAKKKAPAKKAAPKKTEKKSKAKSDE